MKLRAYRGMVGITQSELAGRLGVSELSVIKYESGASVPSPTTMRQIFQVTAGAVMPNDFYELEGVDMSNRIENVSEAAQRGAQVALGLMSGTSMDGIDASLLATDGQQLVHELASHSLRYNAEFRARLRGAEQAVREAHGDLINARTAYPLLDDVVAESTDLHAQVVLELLEKARHKPSRVDVIGYHGQTLYHRPEAGITIQIGDGARLANRVGIPVVCDFRSNDVRHGGQGAPFAPLYHEALALQMGLAPVVVANCGGISNISVITGKSDELFAFDCGPGNGLIDRFVFSRVGKPCDLDGIFGLKGRIHAQVLAALRSSAVCAPDGLNYLDKIPPKSLDINDLHLIPELDELSLQDGCATLEAFSAECIVESLKWVEARGVVVPSLWVLAGGGWRNPVIVRELTARLRTHLGEKVRVQHADDVGWNGVALEAQIFAYLAVRSVRGLALSVPGTTGVAAPVTGGVLHKPHKKVASDTVR
jgi:anhydro-N-acetylmuramic acid kinase